MIKAIQRRKSLCGLIVRLHHGEESWVQVAGQVARIRSREAHLNFKQEGCKRKGTGGKVSLYTLNASPKWKTLPSDLRGCIS